MVCDYCRVAGPVRTFQSDGYYHQDGEGGFFARFPTNEAYEERIARVQAEMGTLQFKLLTFSLALRGLLYQIRKASRIDEFEEWIDRQARRIWP